MLRQILDAAETLFSGDGNTDTTIAAIAEAADVAVQTVYAVFGSKRTVRSDLLHVRVVGDDQSITPKDREDCQTMEREADPRRRVALLASVATCSGRGLIYPLAGTVSCVHSLVVTTAR